MFLISLGTFTAAAGNCYKRLVPRPTQNEVGFGPVKYSLRSCYRRPVCKYVSVLKVYGPLSQEEPNFFVYNIMQTQIHHTWAECQSTAGRSRRALVQMMVTIANSTDLPRHRCVFICARH